MVVIAIYNNKTSHYSVQNLTGYFHIYYWMLYKKPHLLVEGNTFLTQNTIDQSQSMCTLAVYMFLLTVLALGYSTARSVLLPQFSQNDASSEYALHLEY